MKQRKRKGQALVEFALIVPIFLLLVFAVIDFGRCFQAYITVADAVREAGRASAAADASFDSASAVAYINNRLAINGLDTVRATRWVTKRPNGWPGASNDTVIAAISYSYQFRLLQVLIGWTGNQATVNLQSIQPFRNE